MANNSISQIKDNNTSENIILNSSILNDTDKFLSPQPTFNALPQTQFFNQQVHNFPNQMAFPPNHMNMSGMNNGYLNAPNQLQTQPMMNPYSYYQPGSFVQPGGYNVPWNTSMIGNGLQQSSIFNGANLIPAPATGMSANLSTFPNKSQINSNKKDLQ